MANLPTLFEEFDRPLGGLGFGSWRPLLKQLDDFMSEAMGQTNSGQERNFVPAVDIGETDDHYILAFEMPGVPKSDIDIEVQGNTLTVRGERKEEKDEKKRRAHIYERRFGTFMRTITLPDAVKSEDIEANYDNGVLTLAIAKPVESKRQRIQIGEGKGSFFKNLLKGKKEGEGLDVKAKAPDSQPQQPQPTAH